MKPGVVTVGFLHAGEWSASFGQSLKDLYLADAFGSQRIIPNGKELANYCGAGGLVSGRNEIAQQFLDNTDSEWLFMVDSDMGFASDTVDRLIEAAHPSERPVMGGLCFALSRNGRGDHHVTRFLTLPTLYEFVETDDDAGFLPMRAYPRDQVVKVDATGAACLIAHREALLKVRERYGSWFEPITHPHGNTFGEDLSFCVRLAACDIPIHVDTSVKTSHYKGGVYLDEAQYDESRERT